MRGHIRKRGSRYAIVVDAGRSPDGKRIRKWHSGFKTRREAEAALPAILQALANGDYVAPSKLTIEQFMGEWLAAVRTTLRPNTVTGYERVVRRHIVGKIGNITLQQLTHGMIAQWHAQMMSEGLSASSVRKIHFVLRKALQDAMRWNYISKNVATLVRPPSLAGRKKQLTTWTAEELRGFLDSVSEDPLWAGWLLAATTGMRRGEVLGLRWRDIDLDAEKLSISQTLVAPSHEFTFAEPKTASGRRSIALDPVTIGALRSHRRRQAEERLLVGAGYEDYDLVFAMPDGRPILPRQFSKWFRTLVRASELPYIRLHDLRHTHATLAFQSGIHPKVISERLGHSNIQITLDTYTHAIPAMQEDAARRVASLVFD